MLLETSRRYNPAIDSITFLKDFSYNKEDFAKAGAFVKCLLKILILDTVSLLLTTNITSVS